MDESKLKELEESFDKHISVLKEAKLDTRSDEDKKEFALKWAKAGLLSEREKSYVNGELALLLENQKIFDEVCKPDFQGDQEAEKKHKIFMKCVLPIVRRMYDPHYFIGFDIVSVQCLYGPTGLIRYMKPSGDADLDLETYGWSFDTEDVAAKTRKLKSVFLPPETTSEADEADLVQALAWDIAQEFNGEIITDLANNVGTVGKSSWVDVKKLWSDIERMMDAVQKKTGCRPNWLIASTAICNQLRTLSFEEAADISLPPHDIQSKSYVLKLGKLNEVTLYERHLGFGVHRVIMGFRDLANPYHSGYFWAPYVPLAPTPLIMDPSFCPRPGILTRFAKKLLPFGSKFYARLDISDLPEDKS